MIEFVSLWVPAPGSCYAAYDYRSFLVGQIDRGCTLPRRFTFLTDQVTSPTIEVIHGHAVRMVPLRERWEVWASRPRTPNTRERYWCFSKIEAVRPDLWEHDDLVVLTDLDNFVTGPLDGVLKSYRGGWAARQNFLNDVARREGSVWQSSWVMFRPSRVPDIWPIAKRMGADGLALHFKPFGGWGDQAFWSHVRPHRELSKAPAPGQPFGDDLGALYPGCFTSLRWRQENDRCACVVYAHGAKKPHTINWHLPFRGPDCDQQQGWIA